MTAVAAALAVTAFAVAAVALARTYQTEQTVGLLENELQTRFVDQITPATTPADDLAGGWLDDLIVDDPRLAGTFDDAAARGELAAALILAFERAGVPLAEVAVRMERSPKTVRRLLDGDTDMRLSTYQAFARALDHRLMVTVAVAPIEETADARVS